MHGGRDNRWWNVWNFWRVHEWLDACMNGWMDDWMDGRMNDEYMNEWMVEWISRENGWMEGGMIKGWRNEWLDGWILFVFLVFLKYFSVYVFVIDVAVVVFDFFYVSTSETRRPCHEIPHRQLKLKTIIAGTRNSSEPALNPHHSTNEPWHFLTIHHLSVVNRTVISTLR